MNTAPTLRLVVYRAPYAGLDLVHDLAAIRDSSYRNNPGAAITGALVYDRGQFIQALEGPADSVEALLERVRVDRRAGGMDVLIDTSTPMRSLEAWTMQILRVDALPAVEASSLGAFRDAYLRNFRPDAAGFIDLLRSLVAVDEGSQDSNADAAQAR